MCVYYRNDNRAEYNWWIKLPFPYVWRLSGRPVEHMYTHTYTQSSACYQNSFLNFSAELYAYLKSTPLFGRSLLNCNSIQADSKESYKTKWGFNRVQQVTFSPGRTNQMLSPSIILLPVRWDGRHLTGTWSSLCHLGSKFRPSRWPETDWLTRRGTLASGLALQLKSLRSRN